MTDRTSEHVRLEELAAGYALHSLDPADELRFRQHLPHCRRCQHTVAAYTEITAALADTGSGPQPGPQLRDRILAATGPPGQTRLTGSSVQSARIGRRPGRIIITSAAAAVVIVVAVWGGLAARGSATGRPPARCAAAVQCPELALTDARTGRTDATVIIQGQTAWLRPSGLAPDNTARQVYVLWQITGAHTPLAVGSFDVSRHPGQRVRIGVLPAAYRGTWAFAVSLEPGRTIPARPARPVALGQVS